MALLLKHFADVFEELINVWLKLLLLLRLVEAQEAVFVGVKTPILDRAFVTEVEVLVPHGFFGGRVSSIAEAARVLQVVFAFRDSRNRIHELLLDCSINLL